VTVICLVHGPMKHNVKMLWWECHGFDGEGCDLNNITDELIRRLDIIPPGIAVSWPLQW
jgi:hypothetical protein